MSLSGCGGMWGTGMVWLWRGWRGLWAWVDWGGAGVLLGGFWVEGGDFVGIWLGLGGGWGGFVVAGEFFCCVGGFFIRFGLWSGFDGRSGGVGLGGGWVGGDGFGVWGCVGEWCGSWSGGCGGCGGVWGGGGLGMVGGGGVGGVFVWWGVGVGWGCWVG